MRRRSLALTFTVAAAIALAGCSASPDGGGSPDAGAGGSGQSVEDACTILSDAGKAASNTLSDQQLMDDPGAAADAVEQQAEAFRDATAEIDDADVAALATQFGDFYGSLADALRKLADGDVAAMEDFSTSTTEMQDFGDRLVEVCGPQG